MSTVLVTGAAGEIGRAIAETLAEEGRGLVLADHPDARTRLDETAAAARAMAGRGGSMVNVASMAGVSGAPNMPAYSASKAAVIGLTKAAAKDLAPAGVRVNAVSPGFIAPGPMWDTQVAEQAAVGSQYYATEPAAVAGQMVGMVPLRRCGSPREVATVVAFLLSDAASYLTGVNIDVAGGSV